MYVNLLPTSFIWRQLAIRRIRQWGYVYGAFSIAIACWNIPLLSKWWNCQRNLQSIRLAAEPVRKLQADHLQLAKQSLALENRIEQIRNSVTQDRTVSLLGIIAHGVRSTVGAVQIQEMQILVNAKAIDSNYPTHDAQHRATSTISPTSEPSRMRRESQLTLRGIALESESITGFIESLQGSAVLPNVELRSTQERLISDRTIQEFKLECISHE